MAKFKKGDIVNVLGSSRMWFKEGHNGLEVEGYDDDDDYYIWKKDKSCTMIIPEGNMVLAGDPNDGLEVYDGNN